MSNQLLVIYCDGGARGNPGPAAIGAVVSDASDRLLFTISQKIGIATNNEAEYQSLIKLLTELKRRQIIFTRATVKLDSMLVVQQLNGNFKIKVSRLRTLYFQVKILEMELGKTIIYKHIPRSQNQAADFLVNKALDSSL